MESSRLTEQTLNVVIGESFHGFGWIPFYHRQMRTIVSWLLDNVQLSFFFAHCLISTYGTRQMRWNYYARLLTSTTVRGLARDGVSVRVPGNAFEG